MATTNFAKATYCLAGTGVLLGGGYFAKPWIIGDKVIDLIKVHNPEKQVLTTASPSYSDRWKKAWFAYREANKNNERDVWEIGDWKKEAVNKKDLSAPSSFIDACEEKAQVRVSGKTDPLYQQVLDWCTGSTKLSIKDLIRDSGKRSLNEYDSKINAKHGWKPLFNKYFENNKNQTVDPLGLEGWAEKRTQTTSEASGMLDKFIEKCKSLSETVVLGTEDPNYKKVNLHCSADIHAEAIIRESFKERKIVNVAKLKEAGHKALALEIWQRYVSKNREKNNGEDQWAMDSWNSVKDKQEIPEKFWDNCALKRKKPIKGIEDPVFKEVWDYCTIESTKAIGLEDTL